MVAKRERWFMLKQSYLTLLVGVILRLLVTNGYSAEASVEPKLEDFSFLLLDIRSPEEYESGYFEKSIIVPPERVKEFFSTRRIPEKTIIILYCLTGSRSGFALIQARGVGIKNVYNAGGLREMQVIYNKIAPNRIVAVDALTDTK